MGETNDVIYSVQECTRHRIYKVNLKQNQNEQPEWNVLIKLMDHINTSSLVILVMISN